MEDSNMKILYFGPITPKGKPSVGGYEAANRKNIEALRSRGVSVDEFPYPLINKKWGKIAKLKYVKLLFQPLSLLKYGNKEKMVVHTTPLYGNALGFPAVLLLLMSKWLGFKSVVDIRAGSFFYYWNNSGKTIRWALRKLLSLGSAITVEGTGYIKPMRAIVGLDKGIYYFPNLAFCNQLPNIRKDYSSTIRLFYFGRITQKKGIDILLDTIELLGSRFELYLAGSIADDVKPECLQRNRVVYLGNLTSEQLSEQMLQMHIFVFPTSHLGEGQSNSLIEAMSYGLIPVSSNQGFCAEVIADCGKVLAQGSTAQDYKKAIEDICSKDMKMLSKKCQEHIKSCHNIDVEIPKLIQIYTGLLCQ